MKRGQLTEDCLINLQLISALLVFVDLSGRKRLKGCRSRLTKFRKLGFKKVWNFLCVCVCAVSAFGCCFQEINM